MPIQPPSTARAADADSPSTPIQKSQVGPAMTPPSITQVPGGVSGAATPAMPTTTPPPPNQLPPTLGALANPPATPSTQSPTPPTSQIFANDPSRPGSGYVMQNGQPVRIEGTTAAGLGADGQPKPVTAQDRYILDGGVMGDYVNPDDYNAFVNAPHAANTYTPAQQAVNAAPVNTTPHYLQDGVETGADGQPFTPSPMPSNGPSLAGLAAPQSRTDANPWGGAILNEGASLGLNGPTGGGAIGSQPNLGPVSTSSPASNSATSAPGVGLAPITGTASDLRTQSILPTNQPDRFQMAQDRFKTFSDQTDPAFQASLRSATQKAAANGAIGSGMLQTDYGNLADQRDLNLRGERDNLFQNALEGTIGDAANNRNEYRTERGYQNGLEDQAYTRGVQGLTLEDALTNSAFNRAQTQSQAGEAGSPANYDMLLSQLYGNNAAQAGQAMGGLIGNTQQNNILKTIYGQGGGVPPAGGTTGTTQAGGTAGGVDWSALLDQLGLSRDQIPGVQTTPGGG